MFPELINIEAKGKPLPLLQILKIHIIGICFTLKNNVQICGMMVGIDKPVTKVIKQVKYVKWYNQHFNLLSVMNAFVVHHYHIFSKYFISKNDEGE
jgi:hypothetical protein